MSQANKGFTLLEMIVTLLIVSIVLTGAVLLVKDNPNEHIGELARKTQALAKETLRDAKAKDRAYSIHIAHNAIWATADSVQSEDDDNKSSTISTFDVPEDITIFFKNSTEENWTEVRKNTDPLIWAFSQSGLCEAISLRFESDNAVYEMDFHALTASEIQ